MSDARQLTEQAAQTATEAENRALNALWRRKRAEQALKQDEQLITASRERYEQPTLQMARRHVRQAEAHVKRQREIVATFPADSKLRQTAESLLLEFESTLRDHKDHHARLEEGCWQLSLGRWTGCPQGVESGRPAVPEFLNSLDAPLAGRLCGPRKLLPAMLVPMVRGSKAV